MQAKHLTEFLAPWLEQFLADHPFVVGAYLAGSAAELGPEEDLADCSDIDVMLVIEGQPRPKPGKIPYGIAVIEGSYVPWSSIDDPEKALADYHLAHGLHHGRILYDKDGRLCKLCAQVAAEFAKPERVRQRVDSVIRKIEANLDSFDPNAPRYTRAMGLLFAAGIMVHAVLVAAQKNPTVRMRYRAAREVLKERPEAMEMLLEAAGFSDLSPSSARQAVMQMSALFDTMCPHCKTQFPFTSDLQPEMRKSAVDDALSLIDSGLHRESMFWTLATFCRLMLQASADKPELIGVWNGTFTYEMAAMAKVNMESADSQLQRIEAIRGALPALRSLCDEIVGGPAREKTLLFVCGPNGIGKSSVCQEILRRREGTAYVDSDSCRMMNPFVLDDETIPVVAGNISAMIRNYLGCKGVDLVLFSYGLHGRRSEVFADVRSRLAGLGYRFLPVILECSEEENIRRMQADHRDSARIRRAIATSRSAYDDLPYARIDVTGLSLSQTAEQILRLL